MMLAFIEAPRATYGVKPICAVLPIAPATDYAAKARAVAPGVRTQRDATLQPQITAVWAASMRRDGVKKVWQELRQTGIAVARCTVARLMRAAGQRGVARDHAHEDRLGVGRAGASAARS